MYDNSLVTHTDYSLALCYLYLGETWAGWRMGQVDLFDLSEYYRTNRTMAPSTDQRYDYAQL